MKRIYLGVALVTLATLLLELLLTRIFSVTLYYHFAFLVISVALFGLGLSGVRLYLRLERYPREALQKQLVRYCQLFALSGLVALLYVLNHSITTNYDVLKPGYFTWQNLWEISFLYIITAAPFYFSGMVVSLALYHYREDAATLYFFDLVGASLACLVLDPLLGRFGAANSVLLALILVAAAGLLFSESKLDRRTVWLGAGLAVLLMVNAVVGAIDVGSFKWVRVQSLAFSKWNAFSRIEVQERAGQPPDMTIDGMARTVLHTLRGAKKRPPVAPPTPPPKPASQPAASQPAASQPSGQPASKALAMRPRARPAHPPRLAGALGAEMYSVAAMVHVIRNSGRVLIIGPGGGVDVKNALTAGHREIVLAEINPIILYDVMLGRYRKWTGNLYGHPRVKPNLAEGRSFVRRSKQRFDVIQATLVDTWAANASGAFALTENHLYTVEAFEDYLHHLKPQGILTMSRWVHVPGFEFVRLCALARTALDRLGVKHPQRHTFAAFFGPLATLLVKRTPFTLDELKALHFTARKRNYGILYSPVSRSRNPVWQVLGSRDPKKFYARFPIDVRPVYDDRPFFFYAVKPERAWSNLFSTDRMGMNSFSLRVLAALMVVVTLLVLAAIVVPLVINKRRALLSGAGSKLRDLLYFISIGVGFILVEIGLLQRFTLNLGHPIHSLRVVFFGMLFFGGVGSLVSGRVKTPSKLLWVLAGAAGGTALVVGTYSLVLGKLLHAMLGMSDGARIAATLALVALPAFLMGMCLPTGVRLVSRRHDEIVPWAWGLNGAASVLGSVVAMVIALNSGFTTTLLTGAACYGLALVIGMRKAGPDKGAADAPASSEPASDTDAE
ncbi:MAG: hypothetical protein KC503_32315 [Myxococcales bacterium]|nr:hypothetical protein [Myxococcales bacterium]